MLLLVPRHAVVVLDSLEFGGRLTEAVYVFKLTGDVMVDIRVNDELSNQTRSDAA